MWWLWRSRRVRVGAFEDGSGLVYGKDTAVSITSMRS